MAEAHLSLEHEDAFSPGLPPLSTGSHFDGDDTAPGATLTANFLYHLAAKVTTTMLSVHVCMLCFILVSSSRHNVVVLKARFLLC